MMVANCIGILWSLCSFELHIQEFWKYIFPVLQLRTSLDVIPLAVLCEYWIERVTFGHIMSILD